MTKTKKIFTLVLGVILCLGIIVGAVLLARKDNDQQTEYEQAITVVQETVKRNQQIMKTYSDGTGGSSQISGTFGLYAAAATESQLNKYFSTLTLNFMLPTYIDYLMTTSESNMYQNTFALDHTYYAIVQGKTIFVGAKKESNHVLLAMDSNGDKYYCDLQFDFDNNKLISANTLVETSDYVFLCFLDYVNNNMGQIQITEINDDIVTSIKNSSLSYEQYSSSTSEAQIINGNITKNVNTVIVTNQVIEKSGVASQTLFTDFMQSFSFNNQCLNIVNTNNAKINTAIIDATEVAYNKSQYLLREDSGQFSLVLPAVEYDDYVAIMTKVIASNEFAAIATINNRQLQLIKDRGKNAFTGFNYTYSTDEGFLLLRTDKDTYALTTTLEGTAYKYTFGYANNQLTDIVIESSVYAQKEDFTNMLSQLTNASSKSEVNEFISDCYNDLSASDAIRLSLNNRVQGVTSYYKENDTYSIGIDFMEEGQTANEFVFGLYIWELNGEGYECISFTYNFSTQAVEIVTE